MTEFVDRVNLEELDFDDERSMRSDDMFTPSKLMGVAIFGAIAALAGYYVYAQLDSDKRNALRDCVISVAKEQVSSLTAPSKQ
ncbi:MAG: hypothetical protein Q4F00_07710 [bacterium]|nr:hypothetical protein [bacterium]